MIPIKLIVLDVDGTLTDGVIGYDSHGGEYKNFHAMDGLGIVMAQAIGIRIAVITGRSSVVVNRRMSELGVTDLAQGSGDKATKMQALMAKYGLTKDEVAFVGDDLNDLPAYEHAGVKIAMANASEPILKLADYITKRPGGAGGVRDAIDWIIKRQGNYDDAVKAFLDAIAAKEKAQEDIIPGTHGAVTPQ